ncbi:signal peptidase I [Candidatus Woesebacteria bacterium RIFCSPHIGHO2_12_FULL_46_16]|uniref:Signal peptidase I n=1 Tax=Candidatus Woesebacteria bacterium RIFCSPHIGHO2_12_FULL_46_16 TaxID=1802513 RepID=A0A1F8B0G9_9BACT|nr:MAG: signal peptidase I [Candidatus Woesebacteria bacterium RIFCSPHIGHO2_12_FULL_46_16]
MFRRLGAFFLDILEVIVFAVAIFLFIYLLVLQPHKIKGASMDPNFFDGEYLLTDKVTYRFGEPKRGDVIVFKAPTGNGDEFIKRIIGLPGEKVSVKSGKMYINEKVLEEKYLDASLITSAGYFLQEDQSVSVPEGEYFVLGDNRPHSSDSRAWGFIAKKKITGRAWLIYWPLKSAGIVKKVNYN